MGESNIFQFLKDNKKQTIHKTLILTTSTHYKDIKRAKRYRVIGYIIKPYSSNPNFTLFRKIVSRELSKENNISECITYDLNPK